MRAFFIHGFYVFLFVLVSTNSIGQFNSFSFSPRINLGYFFPTQTSVLSGQPFMRSQNLAPLSLNQVILQDGSIKTVILQNGGYGFELFYNMKKAEDEFNWSVGGSFFVQKHLYALDVPDFDYKGSRSSAIIDYYRYLAYKLCLRKYWLTANDRTLFVQLNGTYSGNFKVNDNTWQNPESIINVDYTDNGYGYIVNNHSILHNNFLLELEFGSKFMNSNFMWSVGVTIPFQQYIFKSDVTYYTNNAAIGTTQTRESQTGIWLNLSIPIEFAKWVKKPRAPKPKPVEIVEPLLVKNNRKITTQHTYTTTNKTIVIEIFDNASADGDTASVDYNGTWILENYPVNKEPKQLTIELQEGVNQIALYAISLGTTPPNTAAIAIIDGDTRKVFVLNSDYSHCGSLRIYKE